MSKTKEIFHKSREDSKELLLRKNLEVWETQNDSNPFLSKDLISQINLEGDLNNQNENLGSNGISDKIEDGKSQEEDIYESKDEELVNEYIKNGFNFDFFRHQSNEKPINTQNFINECEIKEKEKEEENIKSTNNEENKTRLVPSSDLNPNLNIEDAFSLNKDYYHVNNKNEGNDLKITMMNKYDNNLNQPQLTDIHYKINGRAGWICPFCNNFNFESKLILINFYILINN